MYNEGFSLKEIADAVGTSEPVIYDLTRTMGIRKPTRLEILDIPKVKALQKAGWTAEEIEYEFGYRFGIEVIRDAMA